MLAHLRWLLNQAVTTLRYEGAAIFLVRLVRVALSPLGELVIFNYCRKSLRGPLPIKEARTAVQIAPLAWEELPELAPVLWASYPPARRAQEFAGQGVEEMLRQRYQRGARCFVARQGGKIVHYNWIFVGRYEASEARIHLGEGEAHCDHGFTVEESRGLGIHSAVNSQMLAYLQAQGYHTAYTRVASDNLSSKKALYQVGWEFFGSLLVFLPKGSRRILSWTLCGPLGPVVPRRQLAA